MVQQMLPLFRNDAARWARFIKGLKGFAAKKRFAQAIADTSTLGPNFVVEVAVKSMGTLKDVRDATPTTTASPTGSTTLSSSQPTRRSCSPPSKSSSTSRAPSATPSAPRSTWFAPSRTPTIAPAAAARA